VGEGEGNLSNGVSRVKCEGMTEPFLALSNRYDSLTFSVPGDIIDFPTDDFGFAL